MSAISARVSREWQRSTTRRVLKWIFRWRTLRAGLIGIVLLVALVALFYAEENWRGKHAWQRYYREREAAGDSLEWSAVTPSPVPDAENFAATPLFAELFPKPSHARLSELPRCAGDGSWHMARTEDFAVFRKECLPPQPFRGRPPRTQESSTAAPPPFTGVDVLAALSKHDPILREVAETSRLPKCRFPIRYEDSFAALLPHLGQLLRLAKIYRLRALAELDTDKSEAALDDIRAGLRLADKLRNEPVEISFVGRMVMVELLTQPVWEGMVAHHWNDRQLAILQREFVKTDYFGSYPVVLRGGRAFAYHIVLWVIRQPVWSRPPLVEGMGTEELAGCEYRLRLLGLVPTGWLYQNMVAVDRFYLETAALEVDCGQRRIHPRGVRQAHQWSYETSRSPMRMLVRVLAGPAQALLPTRLARGQTGVDEAVVACALERYRLAHGEFPERLDVLVPEYITKIPNDVIDGQPLRYRRTPDGQFLLYSIGWNETDDGGTVAMFPGKQPTWNPNEGDWVWWSKPQP